MRNPASAPYTRLDLDSFTRRRLWEHVVTALEQHVTDVRTLPVAPRCEPCDVRSVLAGLSPDEPLAPEHGLQLVVDCMRTQQLHAAHPGYFGLFVPAPSAIAVIAEALAAGFNPQLASWSHAPFGVEAERWVVREVSRRVGLPRGGEGTITTGGSEANLTALLVALYRRYPRASIEGVHCLAYRPVFYVSAEGHHSWRKAARVVGLGSESLRVVSCDRSFRMEADALGGMLAEDRAHGLNPFMVVATVGTTACGAIDPLAELREITAAEGVWLHADGAWGGAAALSDAHRQCVAGLEHADSITLDAHKWMSVPLGAGLYLSRHAGALRAVFATNPHYLPAADADEAAAEPYQESILWSRRFNGLKVLMLLITAGWEGIAEAIDSTFRVGDALRRALVRHGWTPVNTTPLPVVCFRDPGAQAPDHHSAIVASVNHVGRSWISTTALGGTGDAIRACVSNHRTTVDDVDTLLEDLSQARARVRSRTP